MQITQVSYERVFNLGGYQSERIGIQAQVDPDEEPEEVLAFLREFVSSESSQARAAAARSAASEESVDLADLPDLPF